MRLFFMRHAETEINPSKNDVDRDLTDTGINQAKKAAEFLAQHNIDKIIVSYVKRTMQTMDILLQTISVNDREIVTELYEGTEDDVINLLTLQDSKYQNILIIGHNPTIYLTALKLTKPNTPDYEKLAQISMNPAQIIVLEFVNEEWGKISNILGELVETFIPNN